MHHSIPAIPTPPLCNSWTFVCILIPEVGYLPTLLLSSQGIQPTYLSPLPYKLYQNFPGVDSAQGLGTTGFDFCNSLENEISNTLSYYECHKAMEGEITHVQIQITYNSTLVMFFFRQLTFKNMMHLQLFFSHVA